MTIVIIDWSGGFTVFFSICIHSLHSRMALSLRKTLGDLPNNFSEVVILLKCGSKMSTISEHYQWDKHGLVAIAAAGASRHNVYCREAAPKEIHHI